jgi:hypothetical protein
MRRFTLLLLLAAAFAKDPAEGWLGYATATSPVGSGRITFAEAYWVVPENPTVGGAFYSPWFGIEAQPPPTAPPGPPPPPPPCPLPTDSLPLQSSDNLNLIQVPPQPAPHFAAFPPSFCRCTSCSVPRVDVTARAAAAREPLDRL